MPQCAPPGSTVARSWNVARPPAHRTVSAVAQGTQILEAEVRLDRMFAADAAPSELRVQVERIAALRAELRWIHLDAHLNTRTLLTAEQLRRYAHLRHG